MWWSKASWFCPREWGRPTGWTCNRFLELFRASICLCGGENRKQLGWIVKWARNDQVNRSMGDSEEKPLINVFVSLGQKNPTFFYVDFWGSFCQLISVSRLVASTGSESIKVVQSVHLFVRDEAQRTAGHGNMAHKELWHHTVPLSWHLCACLKRWTASRYESEERACRLFSVTLEKDCQMWRKLPDNNSSPNVWSDCNRSAAIIKGKNSL